MFKAKNLNVSDPHVSLHVVADHKISQNAIGGDLGLLDDVGTEGHSADVLFHFDHRGDGMLGPGWRHGDRKWDRKWFSPDKCGFYICFNTNKNS